MMVSGWALAISPQRAADVAFPRVGADRFRQHPHAGFQFRRDDVHHRLHDRGDAGHHDDIAELEAGRQDGRALDQFGAVGNPRHAQPRLVQILLGPAFAEPRHHFGVMVDADAERLGDAVGGDVVMGRPDAAGGKDVIVALSQCIKGGDDIGLLVGDDADFLEVDPDIGQVLGDKADVLVLGPAGQDLVTNDQNARCDDLTHFLFPVLSPRLCASNALKSRGFAAEISTRQPVFQAARENTPYQMPRPMHIALARPLLPSREVMHCVAWLREIVRIYGSRV